MTSVFNECEELILDISSTDGDIFLTQELIDFNTHTPTQLLTTKNKLLYIKDELMFANVFKQLLLLVLVYFKDAIARGGYDINLVTRNVSDGFIVKHKNFIDQLWYWIVYLNIWYVIQFISSIILALVKSKKSII